MKDNAQLFATQQAYHYAPDTKPDITAGKKRAAAYCRVSTLAEEQELSFDSQVSFYSEMIARDPALTLVGVYGDHGFSGLDMSKRKEFQRMITDCEAGLIDVIYVKSVSRFSRNAADALAVLKRLKELGIRVLFEKEGLDSADPATEMILNIYATIAQNESCSQSENMSWAYFRRAQLGNPTRCACFGYRIQKKKGDPFRYWVIQDEEADVVRYIFLFSWQGYHINEIASQTGMQAQRILSMLRNEAYKGDICTHKMIKLDYTSKKQVKNNGRHEQVYIEGHHDPIVEPEMFDEVQLLLDDGMLKGKHSPGRQAWLEAHPEILSRREPIPVDAR